MKKGEQTKEKIIKQAAEIFNSAGYAGASLTDLMNATTLKKGGIYNHFNSKEEILIEAFKHSVDLVKQKLNDALKEKKTAKEKLLAIIEFYRDYPMNPVVKGGCPILNSIVDSDNTGTAFQKNVSRAVNDLIKNLALIISNGIKNNEFKNNLDPHKQAVIIFTSIEGGVAVSRSSKSNNEMGIIIDHLKDYVNKEFVK